MTHHATVVILACEYNCDMAHPYPKLGITCAPHHFPSNTSPLLEIKLALASGSIQLASATFQKSMKATLFLGPLNL